MPAILEYLIKLSISLTVVYLFYFWALRKLTFYTWNRWYLVLYPIMAIIISFTNIGPWLQRGDWSEVPLVSLVPSFGQYQPEVQLSPGAEPYSMAWRIGLLALAAGSVFLLVRLALQYFSLLRIKRRSRLLFDEGVKVYQVDDAVAPFSFGNAIFINQHQHSEEDLREIIRHEFIHVRQKHTLDMLWGECLCILNWYNPFAWLIRHAIRQNLEFIADSKVLENGIDRKQYQYLLLKVVGVPQFSIAHPFNVNSLKKRIAMMNKIKSARLHLVKFMFLLPLAAVLLLAFRNLQHRGDPSGTGAATDTIAKVLPESGNAAALTLQQELPPGEPDQDCYNDKGYCITVADNSGESVVIVKDRKGKIVEAITLNNWNDSKSKYEEKYGKLPPPPPPAPPPPPGTPVPVGTVPPAPALPPLPPAAPRLPKNVKRINIEQQKASVYLKDGKKETYNLENKDEKAAFEKKYGKITELPAVPPAPGIDQGIIVSPEGSPAPVRPQNQRAVRTVIRAVPSPDGAAPLYILDGKVLPPGTDLNTAVSADQIQSVQVLKGPEAISAYGEKGQHGVVKINTVENPNQVSVNVDPVSGQKADREVMHIQADTIHVEHLDQFKGLIILDGKYYTAREFNALNIKSENIKSLNVWKGDEALKKFGEKAREGAIEVMLR